MLCINQQTMDFWKYFKQLPVCFPSHSAHKGQTVIHSLRSVKLWRLVKEEITCRKGSQPLLT
jgi:hypothetical protein